MSTAQRPLPHSFYRRSTEVVARDLLGRDLWRLLPGPRIAGGRIVEVEAYFGHEDPASHAYRRTPRSEIMYGPPGLAYVYFTYGMHCCLNVVCEPGGTAGAVLIRAIEPKRGIEEMAERRGAAAFNRKGRLRLGAICSGPGKLTQALAIDLALNGADLRGPEIWLSEGEGPLPDAKVEITPRVGIRRGAELPARFIVPDSPCLSRRSGSTRLDRRRS